MCFFLFGVHIIFFSLSHVKGSYGFKLGQLRMVILVRQVRIHKARVRRGAILMAPDTLQVLGGYVEELEYLAEQKNRELVRAVR